MVLALAQLTARIIRKSVKHAMMDLFYKTAIVWIKLVIVRLLEVMEFVLLAMQDITW